MKQVVLRKLYRLSHFFWYLFILTLPLGARLIIKPRIVEDIFIEWGTVSIFASEIILLIYYFITLLLVACDWATVKNRILEYKKVLIVLSVFLVLTSISALSSEFFVFSVFSFVRLLEASLLFLSIIILRPSFKTTALIFSLSLIPSFVLGIFQFWEQFSPANKWFGIAEHLSSVLGTSVLGLESGRFLRAYGTFPHPNIFAAYMVVNFWLLVSLILNIKEEALRRGRQIMLLFLYLLFFLNFYVLFLTFSRAGWLALAVSFLVVGCWLLVVGRKIPHLNFPPLKRGEGMGILILFSALLIFASILVYVHSDLVFSRISGDSYLEAKSVSERVEGYKEWKQVFLENFLFGAGPGAYTFALEQRSPNLSSYQIQPVHNVWLLILSELGILGFLAFIIFLVSIFTNIRDYKNHKFALISVLVSVLLVLSFFDHYLWSLWQGLALGTLMLTISLDRRLFL